MAYDASNDKTINGVEIEYEGRKYIVGAFAYSDGPAKVGIYEVNADGKKWPAKRLPADTKFMEDITDAMRLACDEAVAHNRSTKAQAKASGKAPPLVDEDEILLKAQAIIAARKKTAAKAALKKAHK